LFESPSQILHLRGNTVIGIVLQPIPNTQWWQREKCRSADSLFW